MRKRKSNSRMNLTRRLFAKNIIIVTGSTRSGKSMLAPIISTLKQAEVFQVNHLVEQFPMLTNLGFISDDVAVYLLRYAADLKLYKLFIGRDVNFRYSDDTSIWKTRNPSIYLKRLFTEEGDLVFDRISKANPMFVLLFHNALWHAKIFLKAFPSMKMLHSRRHPVDVIYSWYGKGYGADFFEKPRNATLTVKWKSKILPYYAIGWEAEYDKLSEMDRIIYMINKIKTMCDKALCSLSEKDSKKIMIVTFEEMVTKPKLILSRICSFLNTSKTLYTSVVLKRERCPRILSDRERKKKLEVIKSIASDSAIKLLTSMIHQYENNKD